MDLATRYPENKRIKSREGSSLWNVFAVGFTAGLIAAFITSLYIVPYYQQWREGDVFSGDRQPVLDEESAVVRAVKKSVDSVVSIVVSKDLPKYEQVRSPFSDFFFTLPSGQTERQQVGAGSGFFVRSDGWIVTNKHVVSDTEAEYTVITKNGDKYQAEVLAVDPFNDLAIVKIDGGGFPVLKLGDSNTLELGQTVIAIGNVLGEFQNTVTTGVVSGVKRDIVASGSGLTETESLSEVIQTDAAVNPGNSGGPLLNVSGEVIGVNTAVSQGAQLIGFAIPIEQVKKVISDVSEFGKVRRPFLGVRYTAITDSFAELNDLPVTKGVLIVRGSAANEPAVLPGSPADKAGINQGDIILEIEGQEINQDRQLTDILRNYNPGDRVVLKILTQRGGEKSVSVVLGEAQ